MQLSSVPHQGPKFPFRLLLCGGLSIGDFDTELFAFSYDQTSDSYWVVGADGRSVAGSKSFISLSLAHIRTLGCAFGDRIVVLGISNISAIDRQLPISSQICIRMTTPAIADAFVFHLQSLGATVTYPLSKYDSIFRR